ncbi:MAG TPA: fibronectin type III domain-containing protein, partial [Cytophagales bacterium]|nr:fibronectin type III domain-containing protein [Cytophagales bacterium]
NSNNEDNFIVESRTSILGAWEEIATLPANTIGYSHTDLSQNIIVYYRVRARNSAGTSGASDVVSATTLTAPAPDANPVTIVQQTEFVASWSAVSGAISYQIDVSTDDFATFVTGYESKSVLGTTTEISNLSPNTPYKFRVRAVNLGGPSPNSSEISVTTLPAIPPKPVTIAATNITASSFTARWNPSTGATSYQLDVSADNFQTFLPGFNSKTITGTSASVTSLSPNTPYQYRVRAKNAGGTSISSNDRSVTTLNLQPAAPVASPATSKSKNGFTVHWSRVATAVEYRFDLSTNNFSSYITGYQNKATTDTFLIVTGLSPETPYQYRVRAVNNGGTSSNSNVVSETTLPDVPGQPTALTASNVAQNSFTANWEGMLGSTSYELDVSKDNFLTFVPGYSSKSVTGTSVEVTGLSPKTAYKYRIRSMNAGGESVNSNVIDVTTLPALPAAPVAYDAASITQTGFKASWSLVPGATEYQFDLSNDNFATNIPGYNNLVVTDTPLVVSNLVANSTYKYRVRAVNAAGISPNSNIITITTLPNPPDAPVAKEATDIRKTRFTAHWTSISSATEYYIDVSSDNFNTLLPNYDNREITDTTLEVTGLLVNTTYQYRVRAGNRAGISGNSNTMNVTTLPNVFGSPLVTNTETLEDTQSPPDLTVQRSLPEDPDITYFKVSNIIGGTLYKNDGITQIQEGAFITVEDGKQGLRFTPGLNSIENGSFDVQASSNNNNSGLSGEIATATITVLPVNDPPLLSNDDSEPLLFSQGDLNTVITTSMLVEDVDDTLLDSAVIQIVEGYEKGRDFIFFKNTDEIQVKPYDSENGILVLIGKAEKSVWEEALNSVLFYNNYIGEAAVGLKTVTFKIWDGKAYSEPIEKRIQITDVFVEINIPEGITPNDDGTNDLWTIENIDLYPDCIVEVYGKNGQRLFQSQGYKEKWNGSHNNQPLGIGTYYYFIDLREKGKKYKGTVAILR